MKVEFNKKIISAIVPLVRLYKKLYVTTEGAMYRSEEAVEQAVRTKNQILGEAADFLGYIVMTEDMVSADKLRGYGKNTATFDALFADAIIPRAKKVDTTEGRKPEEAVSIDEAEQAEINKALGVDDTAVAEATEETAKTTKKTRLWQGQV